MKFMLMNLLNDGGDSGGGAGTPPPAVDTSGQTPVGDTTFTAPEWAKGLSVDQEILKAPMFSSIKSVDDVVKGYYHAQKLVGADKVVVPNKNSSPEEWRQYYVKAGLPADFNEYKVELPKFFAEDQNFQSELAKTAYELNIRPDQLSKVSEMFDKFNEKIMADYEASEQAQLQQVATELKQEWGQGYDKQIARANRVIKHFGGEEMHKAVLNSELANNKEFLKLMAKIGEKIVGGEDSFQAGSTEGFAMTRQEAQSKINAIMSDLNSPYHNEQHAQHKEFVDKVLKYHEVLASR